MCGIAGIAGRNAARTWVVTARQMLNAQAHRGPDGWDVIAGRDGRAVLGMNTLRIVDSRVDLGPYEDPGSGVVLTFNGEIYNFRQVAAQLGIRIDAGESDAHLVLRAWVDRGAEVLADLDGMFALAVYDPRDSTLTLARDRLGEKPLYWRQDGDRIAFASEPGALLEYAGAAVTGRAEMLAVESPLGSETPYAGVQLLEPGHVRVFDVVTTSSTHRCYWSLPQAEHRQAFAVERGDYDQAVATLTRLLGEHVPARIPTDPWALLLSGGLDSALLAYLMRPPVCVTVRYPGYERLDESAAAARVATAIGAQLVVVEPTLEEFRAGVPDLVRALGYPMGNASTFSEHAAYAAVADLGMRVVAGGAGPDELLLGYARHAIAVFGSEAAFAGGLGAYQPLAAVLTGQPRATGRDAYLRLVLRGPDDDGAVAALITGRMDGSTELGQALTLADLEVSWRALMLTSDALASRLGLERRSPYLARELVEFAYAMPLAHKLRVAGAGKSLLRDAAGRLGVPDELRRCGDKLGFASPVPAWLSGPLEPWCLDLLDQAEPLAPAGVLRDVLHRGRHPGGPFERARSQALMTAVWLLQQHEHPTPPRATAAGPTEGLPHAS